MPTTMPGTTRIRAAAYANDAGELCLPYQVEGADSLQARLAEALADGPVVLDFEGVTLLTSTCLNTFLGPLYGVHPQAVIRERLRLDNASADIIELIRHSVPRWLAYFETRRTDTP